MVLRQSPHILYCFSKLMRDTYEDLTTAYNKYDTRRRGYLVATDFQKMLFEFNILLNDDQMFDLIERYAHVISTHDRMGKLMNTEKKYLSM